jgi:dienelactone hydrolase
MSSVRRTTGVILVAVAAIALAGACGGNGDPGGSATSGKASDPTAAAPSSAPSTTIGTGDGTTTMRTEVFTDPSRPTGATPGRVLPTDIHIPGGTGPFPMIVHAHGLAGNSGKFSELLTTWSRAGYVVVAPNFPLTTDAVPAEQRDVGDVVQQPADLRFVTDQVLAMNRPGGALEGLIDPNRLGISGLSLGGATTYAKLFHPCCVDERFRSAVLMSAFLYPQPGGEFAFDREFPVLVFAGTADTAIPYAVQQEAVAQLPGPTWAVTLTDGNHSWPFENTPSPHDQVVVDTSLAFWDGTLRDDTAALERIPATADVAGLATVTVTP